MVAPTNFKVFNFGGEIFGTAFLTEELMSARNCQIFVTKLPRDETRDDVKDKFRTFGKIREITLKKGYAFVVFFDFDLLWKPEKGIL